MSLDETGHLQCSYLGTDPAMFTTPTAEVREIDYAELDGEMKQLQKVIKEQQHKASEHVLPIALYRIERKHWCSIFSSLQFWASNQTNKSFTFHSTDLFVEGACSVSEARVLKVKNINQVQICGEKEYVRFPLSIA